MPTRHLAHHWSAEFSSLRSQMNNVPGPLIQVDSELPPLAAADAPGKKLSYRAVQLSPARRKQPLRHASRLMMNRANHQPIPAAERQLLSNLLRASGRDPESFTAVIQADGLVRVSGPRGTAFYPRENWFTRFSRHLDNDFFDPQQREPNGPRFSRKDTASPVN